MPDSDEEIEAMITRLIQIRLLRSAIDEDIHLGRAIMELQRVLEIRREGT